MSYALTTRSRLDKLNNTFSDSLRNEVPINIIDVHTDDMPEGGTFIGPTKAWGKPNKKQSELEQRAFEWDTAPASGTQMGFWG